MNEVQYEHIEWCDIWFQNAPQVDNLPRVLLIGDSITRGYYNAVAEELTGIVEVDRVATSRSLSDPCLFKEIGYVLSLYDYSFIHANNGLHGWHIEDTEEEYGAGVTKLIDFLKENAPNAKIGWAQSTPVMVKGNITCINEEKNPRVIKRNELALKVMEEKNIPIDDLYSFAIAHPEIRAEDGVHYTSEGSKELGSIVAEFIKSNR